jgi:hypothetical protein
MLDGLIRFNAQIVNSLWKLILVNVMGLRYACFCSSFLSSRPFAPDCSCFPASSLLLYQSEQPDTPIRRCFLLPST